MTPAGPPFRSPGTEVTNAPSQESKAEHENPRMDMNPKLRFSSGRLPSRLKCAPSSKDRLRGVECKIPGVSELVDFT